MHSLGLSLADARGQCYDGASSMSGKYNGAAALVQQHDGADKAFCAHCLAHGLNLCIVSTCQIKEVQVMWATLKELSLFFSKSPKREACLQRMIQENAATSSATKTKLVDLGRTRWIARHDALTAINQLFEVVVSTLEEISGSSTDPWTPESITQASGLLRAITSFSFIVTMTITKDYGLHQGEQGLVLILWFQFQLLIS